MNKKITTKVSIDIVMCILFVLEMNIKVTGFDLHEVLGLIAGIIIISHLTLNYSWIKGVLKNKNKNKKIKSTLILNFLLLISCTTMIITGIIISKFIFSFDNNPIIIRKIHKLSSYISCGIILIHILMHFKYLKNIFIKVIKEKNLKNKMIIGICSIILIFVVFYSLFIAILKKEVVEDKENNTDKEEKINSKKNDNNILTDKNENNDTVDEIEPEPKPEPKPTLEEYLGSLHCDGCGRRCSLLSPRCGTGVRKAEQAKIDYNERY